MDVDAGLGIEPDMEGIAGFEVGGEGDGDVGPAAGRGIEAGRAKEDEVAAVIVPGLGRRGRRPG